MFEKLNDAVVAKPERKKLVHASGRFTEALVEEKEYIGHGIFGVVKKVEASFGEVEGEKNRTFAVKQFHNEEYVDNSIAVHTALKKAGVETWSTYRRVDGEPAVLMTYGGQEGAQLISPSGESQGKEKYKEKKIDEIEGFEKAIQKAIDNAKLAGENGILVPGDAWFASVKERENTDPNQRKASIQHLFIGDYDDVGIDFKPSFRSRETQRKYSSIIHEDIFEKEYAIYRNLYSLYCFVDVFSDQFFSEEIPESVKSGFLQIIANAGREIDSNDKALGRWGNLVQRYERKKNQV